MRPGRKRAGLCLPRKGTDLLSTSASCFTPLVVAGAALPGQGPGKGQVRSWACSARHWIGARGPPSDICSREKSTPLLVESLKLHCSVDKYTLNRYEATGKEQNLHRLQVLKRKSRSSSQRSDVPWPRAPGPFTSTGGWVSAVPALCQVCPWGLGVAHPSRPGLPST